MRLRLFLIFVLPILLLASVSCGTKNEPPTNDNTAPYIAYLYYPYHNSTNQSRTPYFSWKVTDADGDALTYELSLEKGAVEIFNSGAIVDTFLYFTETLEESTLYQWKITASDGELSTSSNFYNFTTGTGTNNPPYKPYNMNPHGSDHPVDVTLQWECLDPDGDPLTFDVWLGTEIGSLTRISASESDTFFDVNSLDLDTHYIWQIYAFDPHGTPSSRLSDFSTQLGGMPDPPFDPHPADGRSDVSIDTVLSWSGSHPDGRPLTYDVYFGPAGTPPPPVSTGQTAISFTPPTLLYTTTYNWGVVAEDDQLQRTEGPLWSFTTEEDPSPTEGIYAELVIGRRQYYDDFDSKLIRLDSVSARFDSVYAPDNPIHPMQAASVTCTTASNILVPWNAGMNRHYFDNLTAGYFLAPGHQYTFIVEAGGGVPALTESIVYPACVWPYITSPAASSNVPRTGFELQWADPCGGTMIITIEDLNYGMTDVYIVTDDDGSYTFTADDLSGLDPMAYQMNIILNMENRRNIAAPGYDSRSFILSRTIATQFIYLDQ